MKEDCFEMRVDIIPQLGSAVINDKDDSTFSTKVIIRPLPKGGLLCFV